MTFNKSIIGGYLTRDPELRYTPKGTVIARLSVAVNRTWKTEAGEKKEEVSFIECDAFGRTAETLAQYFKKGKPILIEGRLKQETWDDKQSGQKRSKLKVIVESFSFVESSGGGERQAAAPQNEGAETPARTAQPEGGHGDDAGDDQVPF